MSILSRSNIAIAEAVVAVQPRAAGEGRQGIEPGRAALFRLGDGRADIFACTDGAVYALWRSNPDRQLGWMLRLKKELISDCGCDPDHVEEEFRRCAEYREYRDELRRLRKKRQNKIWRNSVGTR